MEGDIEKRIEYELQCGDLIKQMFHPSPSSLSHIGNTLEPVPSIMTDFILYDDPIQICGCREAENKEKDFSHQNTHQDSMRTICQCGKANLSFSKRENELRRLLNAIRAPIIKKNENGIWRIQISSMPIKRKDVLKLSEKIDDLLNKQLAQEKGVCPTRRHLFGTLFDEMIRQEIIISPDRGLLLMRMRDELKMSLMAFEALYEQGLNYGMQKRLMADTMLEKLKHEHEQIQNVISQLKHNIKLLHEEFKDQKLISDMSVSVVRARALADHRQQEDIKNALQTQLNEVLPEIEKIEKERRLQQLL